jgi:hypothetical protein
MLDGSCRRGTPGFQVATGVPRFAPIPSLWVFLIPLPYRVSVTTTVFPCFVYLERGLHPFPKCHFEQYVLLGTLTFVHSQQTHGNEYKEGVRLGSYATWKMRL